MMRRCLRWVLLLALMGIVACGSDDSGNGGGSGGSGGTAGSGGSGATGGTSGAAGASGGAAGGGGKMLSEPTAEEIAACEEVARAQCERFEECDARFSLNWQSVEQCADRNAQFCAEYAFADGHNNPAEDVSGCADVVEQSTCDELLAGFYTSNGVPPQGCLSQPGSREVDEPCVSGQQCKSLSCSITPGKGCGVCVERKAQGESCSNNLGCELGLQCVQGTCQPTGTLGSDCGLFQPSCEAPLACVEGKCAQAKKLGDDCTTGTLECDLFDALWCSDVTQTCQPMGSGQMLNDECGVLASTGVLTACSLDTRCQLPPNTNEGGTCIAEAQLGEDCVVDTRGAMRLGSSCAADYQCIDGKCVEPDRHACVR